MCLSIYGCIHGGDNDSVLQRRLWTLLIDVLCMWEKYVERLQKLVFKCPLDKRARVRERVEVLWRVKSYLFRNFTQNSLSNKIDGKLLFKPTYEKMNLLNSDEMYSVNCLILSLTWCCNGIESYGTGDDDNDNNAVLINMHCFYCRRIFRVNVDDILGFPLFATLDAHAQLLN